MNKQQTLLLSDYLSAPSDTRLSILVQSINPSFRLTKNSKASLLVLLEDYKKDPGRPRIKALEGFLGDDSQRQAKAQGGRPMLSKIPIGRNRDVKYRIELRSKIEELRNKRDPKLKAEIVKMEEQLYELEIKAGFMKLVTNNKEAQEDFELMMVRSILGDWDKQGTFSNEILFGNRNRFTLQSVYDVPMLIGWLIKHSGHPARDFDVVNAVGEGTYKNTQAWVLTDKGAGLAPYDSSQTTYYKNGAVSAIKQGSIFR